MTLSSTPASTSRRSRRIRRLVAVVCVTLAGFWLWVRHTDRRAWPAPLPDVRLEPRLAPPRPDESNAWDALRRLVPDGDSRQPYAEDWIGELRRFDRYGFTDPQARYPALERWHAGQQEEAFEHWAAAAAAGSAAPLDEDLAAQVPVLLRVVELSRLSAYRASRARRDGDWEGCLERWRETLSVAQHVTREQGSLGLFVALNATVSVSRDVLLAAVEDRPPEDFVEAALHLLREAEAAMLPLSEAVRHDRLMAHRALDALYTRRTREMPPDIARRHPSAFSLRLARWLGSRPEVSAAHVDALASHAIAAAEAPYDRGGLFAGLPAWCRLQGRPPWSRDPMGALAAVVFVRNTIGAPATNPNRRAELRAARIALAFHRAREARTDGTWPETLETLLDFGLDREALIDPFAPDGRSWVVHPPDEHWRIHGMGLDQEDHGGGIDWFSNPESPVADLVYSSAERERRAKLEEAATQPATQPLLPAASRRPPAP